MVLGGGLEEHMPNLIDSTHRCLEDKNQVYMLCVQDGDEVAPHYRLRDSQIIQRCINSDVCDPS